MLGDRYAVWRSEDDIVTVLALAGEAYREHGVFRRGERATSALLGGLAVEVGEVFDVG